ncbi:hypothetical protein B5F36_12675 [Anaerofilum sp. An201]|nr:hypothetical protein B5F36_12675 [Anaerofilum sp. An201]
MSTLPSTGDASSPAAIFLLLLLSAVMGTASHVYRKKSKQA